MSKPTSWDVIKTAMLNQSTFGGDNPNRKKIGYQFVVNQAVGVFMAMSTSCLLKDHDKAVKAFNADEDVKRILG